MATTKQIEELRTAAAAVGDERQVAICGAALDGSMAARGLCAGVINEARAQDEDWDDVRLDAESLTIAVDGVTTTYRSADDIRHAIRELETAERITPAVCGSMLAELDE